MKNCPKEVNIELFDETSKGKIFNFETHKFYDSKEKVVQGVRKHKIKKIEKKKIE
jgi:hypothetical protein